MKKNAGWVLTILMMLAGSKIFPQQMYRPFPQHVQYYSGSIMPSQVTQLQMDDSVRAFYLAWKDRFIIKDPVTKLNHIKFESSRADKQCVSEGQGYGMMIEVLMAGVDPMAREVYDGLFRYCRKHPSKYDPYLMAWAQDNHGRDLDGSSATDGDMDIAYSLLLADSQWGSRGAINYLEEARSMIHSIMNHEMNAETFSVLLSDAVEPDSEDYFDMRSSDFMPSHFRSFEVATGDENWSKAINSNYRIFQKMQDQYSEQAGLVPDFILHVRSDAKPAHSHYLESRFDGMYNYNACRVPWRLATDYLISGDKRALDMLSRINKWIEQTSLGNPDNISAGYNLEGEDLAGRHFEALSFITPFAVSAMVNRSQQQWLNKLWDYIEGFKLEQFDYYDNSIKMINLIILSGNYWAPDKHLRVTTSYIR